MIRLDEKLLFNQNVLLTAEQQIQFYKQSFDEMLRQSGQESLSDEQQTILNEFIAGIEAQSQSQLLEIDRDEWGRNVSVSQSDGYERVAYGYCRLSGIRSFFTADQGESGEFSHQYITLTYHEIKQVQKLFLDNQEVEFSGVADSSGRPLFGWSVGDTWGLPPIGKVFLSAISRGTTDQLVNSDLLNQALILFPSLWSSAHRQQGHSGIYLILYYDAEVFPNGNPEISVEGYWKNDIYDPRTGATGWTDNSALIWADYMTMTSAQGGPGFTYDDIDYDSICYAADWCDDLIDLAAGGTEKRYTTNGYFDLSSGYGHNRVKQDLEAAMAGSSVRSSGKWKVYAGGWRAPVKTLGVGNLLGPLSVQVKPSLENIYNRVKGLYISPENNWELTEYPPIVNGTYATEDGAERWEQLDLIFVSSGSQAQRIAKIKLESGRQWITVSAEFNIEAIALEPGDIVLLNYERYGWEEKPFEVISFDGKTQGPKVTTILLLKETAEAIYDWSEEETTIDLAPNTTLPDPTYVRVPSGIVVESGTAQLDIRSDGTVFSRMKVSWAASQDVFVLSGGFHEIQFKRSSESDWRNGVIVGGRDTYAYILDIRDGDTYDVRVRATTTFGQSAWVTTNNHLVLGKSEAPSTPSSFTYEVRGSDILLKWSQIADPDLSSYEIRLGTTFDSGTLLVNTKSSNYVYRSLVAGIHTFWIKAVDTSGNLSTARSLNITISPPGQTGAIDALAIFSMVRLAWVAAPSGTFPIAKYRIYKGDVFGTSLLLGEINATVFPIQEQSGGTYTYWVEPVDSYGNVGTANYIVVNVKAFSFFQLITDLILSSSEITSSTNALIEANQVLLGIDRTTTWNAHFTGNSWDSPDDQVNAGYPYWIQPTLTDGEVVFVYDYGSTISTAQVGFDVDGEWVDGSGTVVIKVATSPDNSTWTEETASSMIGTSFRYVRLTIETTGDDDTSFYSIDYPRLRMDVLTEEDYGSVSAVSTDASGTLVTYNKDFLDVFEDSVKLTPKTSSFAVATYSFSGNDLYVFLWDAAGSRISGDLSWGVIGVVAR